MKRITPKTFRQITVPCFDNLHMKVGIGNPASQESFNRFCEKFNFKVKRSYLAFVKEFGGKLPRNISESDGVIPGNFSKTVTLGDFCLLDLKEIDVTCKLKTKDLRKRNLNRLMASNRYGFLNIGFLSLVTAPATCFV